MTGGSQLQWSISYSWKKRVKLVLKEVTALLSPCDKKAVTKQDHWDKVWPLNFFYNYETWLCIVESLIVAFFFFHPVHLLKTKGTEVSWCRWYKFSNMYTCWGAIKSFHSYTSSSILRNKSPSSKADLCYFHRFHPGTRNKRYVRGSFVHATCNIASILS